MDAVYPGNLESFPRCFTVEDLLHALETQFRAMQAQATADGLSMLVAMQQSIDDYQRLFAQFVGHQRLATEELRHMQAQAEQARLQFELVELDMYDQVRGVLNSGQALEGDPLSLAEQASALQRKLLVTRNSEFLYVQTGEPVALERWRESTEEMSNAMELLQGRVDENSEESLAAAMGALVEYRQAFQRYRDSLTLSQQTALQMDTQAQSVLHQVEQVAAERQVQMDARGRSVMLLQAVGPWLSSPWRCWPR